MRRFIKESIAAAGDRRDNGSWIAWEGKHVRLMYTEAGGYWNRGYHPVAPSLALHSVRPFHDEPAPSKDVRRAWRRQHLMRDDKNEKPVPSRRADWTDLLATVVTLDEQMAEVWGGWQAVMDREKATDALRQEEALAAKRLERRLEHAAPKLLAALEVAHGLLCEALTMHVYAEGDTIPEDCNFLAAIAQAEAALAEAKGERVSNATFLARYAEQLDDMDCRPGVEG